MSRTNAKLSVAGKGYGPPIMPGEDGDSYTRLRAADPNRPVMLNLGQGVAWEDYIGRGHAAEPPRGLPRVYQRLWTSLTLTSTPRRTTMRRSAGTCGYVAYGWSGSSGAPSTVAWNCIEFTRSSNKEQHKATPSNRAWKVWMALTHGSMGLSTSSTSGSRTSMNRRCSSDPAMLAAVSQVNHQIAGAGRS